MRDMIDEQMKSVIDKIDRAADASSKLEDIMSMISTTDVTDPRLKEFLGLAPDQHLLAIIYIGYPLQAPAPVSRPGFEDRTLWME